MTLDTLPSEVRSFLQAQLRPGETVLWVAQPDVDTALYGLTTLKYFYWTALIATAGFVSLALPAAADFGGKLVGAAVLLVVICVVFVVGLVRWLNLRSRASRKARLLLSASVVTDQRAMNLCAGRRSKVASYEPAQLTNLKTFVASDGIGSILFFEIADTYHSDEGPITSYDKHGFFDLPDLREAERQLRTLVPPPLTD